jgi:TatD DNase family protein
MLFDTHCHLNFNEFKPDYEQVVERAHGAGITDILVPAIDINSCRELLSYTQTQPIRLHIALGLHPYFIEQHTTTALDELTDLLGVSHHKLAAIGECGIDREVENLAKQQAIFSRHIALANQFQLPLIVHHRRSHDLIAQAFKQCPPKFGGVIHAFSGSIQQAEYYIKLGFKLGIGGTITYERANKTREVVSKVPLSSLVLETDAPSMPLNGFQGLRNEPAKLQAVFNAVCELRDESADDIEAMLYQSSVDVFLR